MSKKNAIFAGSFDPITLGHLDVLNEASKIFDKIIIAIAQNPQKQPMFSVDERKNMIKLCTNHLPNIVIESFDGLTAEFANKNGVDVLIRGLRNTLDFEAESQLAYNNKLLSDNIQTVFFLTRPEHSFISSSGVREILKYKGDISKFVNKDVEKFINSKL